MATSQAGAAGCGVVDLVSLRGIHGVLAYCACVWRVAPVWVAAWAVAGAELRRFKQQISVDNKGASVRSRRKASNARLLRASDSFINLNVEDVVPPLTYGRASGGVGSSVLLLLTPVSHATPRVWYCACAPRVHVTVRQQIHLPPLGLPLQGGAQGAALKREPPKCETT